MKHLELFKLSLFQYFVVFCLLVVTIVGLRLYYVWFTRIRPREPSTEADWNTDCEFQSTAVIEENHITFSKIRDFILDQGIDLIIVGPEKPLVEGIVDFLRESKIKIFGPNKIASQLEGSKIFTKQICEKFNIPTAKFGVFKSRSETNEFLKKTDFPVVIKANNLASGKGVYICHNLEQSNIAVQEIFNGKFGKAENLIIEEFLDGEEMSF